MNSGEVAQVAAQARRYRPDAIIVYTGHNEFIALEGGLPGWAEKPVKILSRLKLAQAAGAVVAVALGEGSKQVMRSWEEEPEQGLILRRPPPSPPPAIGPCSRITARTSGASPPPDPARP